MIGGMGSAVTPDLSKGGEIDGDLVITGDFKVEGAGSFAYDEIVEGKLSVQYTDNTTTSTDTGASLFEKGLQIKNTSSTNGAYSQLHLRAGTADGYIRFIHNNTNDGRFGFYTDNTNNVQEMMTIANDGNVGIGTSSPATHLHLNGTSPDIRVQVSSGNNFGSLQFYNNSGALASAIGNYGHTQNLYFQVQGGNNAVFGTTVNKFYLDVEIENQFPKVIFDDTQGGAMQIGSNSGDIRISQNASGDSASTETIRVLNTGAVGIGTSSPTAKLHVLAGNDNDAIRITGADANYYGSLHYTNASNTTFNILNSYTSATGSAIKLGFGSVSNNTNVMTLLKSGNVGIGTVSPSDYGTSATNLVIYEAGSAGLSIITGTSNTGNIHFGDGTSASSAERRGMIRYDHSSDDFIFWTAGSEKLRITDDGNVGIGGTPVTVTGVDTTLTIKGTTASLGLFDTDHHTTQFWELVSSNGDIRFDYSNSQKMAITSSGKTTITAGTDPVLNLNKTGGGNNAIHFEHAGVDKGYIYVDASQNMKFGNTTTNPIMTMIANGNIGIGTASPQEALHVAGKAYIRRTGTATAHGDTDLFIADSTSSASTAQLQILGGTEGSSNLYFSDTASYSVGGIKYAHNSNHMYFRLNDADKMTLNNTGLGIGTSPSNKLHIFDGTYNLLFDGNEINHSDANEFYIKSGGSINFQPNATTRFIIDSNSRISLSNNDGGTSNTVFGQYAGNVTITGDRNTAIGDSALRNGGSGVRNTAVGESSMYKNSTGGYNVAVGRTSLYYNVSGNYNVAIGHEALFGVSGQSHSSNTAVGYQSLYSITTGSDNVVQGYSAGLALTTGVYNVILGSRAGENITTQSKNVYIGRAAGISNNTGSENIAIGYVAGRYVTGNNNVFLGTEAGDGDSGGSNASNNTGIGYQSLKAITTGSSNVAVGYQALDVGTTVTSNVAIGGGALGSNVSGNYSTAVGQSCLLTNTQAFMTAVGYNALRLNSSGSANVGFGYNAGYGNHTGGNNTYIGYEAGKGVSNNANSNNTGIGKDALKSVTTGSYNTALGKDAGDSVTSGEKNVFVGTDAGQNTTSQSNCVFVGYGAGATAQVTGTTGIGYQALTALTSGAGNTAIGYQALDAEDDGNYNTAVGYQALTAQTGTSGTVANTALGYQAGYAQTTGNNNTFIGYKCAGVGVVTGVENTALGTTALNALTTGSTNTAVGTRAGLVLTEGDSNTFIGKDAGDSATVINEAVLIGHNAGHTISTSTTSDGTIGIGAEALASLTTGAENVAIGYEALDSITTTSGNTAIGYNAGKGGSNANFTLNVFIGKNAGKISSGDGGDSFFNVGVGNDVLTGLNGGDKNVAIGRASGTGITTGKKNTLLGYGTNINVGGGDYQIAIGNEVVGTADNRVHIGNETSHIYNDFNTNATWTHSSDERQKKEIKDDTLGLDFINDIRPVTYKHKSPSEFPKEWNAYNADDKEPMGGDKTIHGLIAQEVKQALDKQDVDTFSGWDKNPDGRQNVSFEAFVLPLIKSVQELSAEIDKLKKQLEDK